MTGGYMPEFGGLPPAEDVYGVQMIQPEGMAANFWRKPEALRRLITSAWGVRNMPEAEFYRRLMRATPTAATPFRVGWGRHGMAVRPIGRMA